MRKYEKLLFLGDEVILRINAQNFIELSIDNRLPSSILSMLRNLRTNVMLQLCLHLHHFIIMKMKFHFISDEVR